MDSADDLTFRIIFSGDGAGRLRDRVKEKLKEFMGDYTDDTLVEYVIVLLKNGRRKEEARNELNVFLGDDSDSFVSWLWEHLRSNLSLYAQPKESRPDEVVKQKAQSDVPHLKSESEVIRSDKLSKSRRSKDWKGVIRDSDEPPPPPLRSAVIANIHSEDVNRMERSPSPQPLIQRKRGRSGESGQADEQSQVKREAVSKPALGASRRLLQFAVRDAVATSRSTGLTSEPSFKRLRSVVSTPTDDDSSLFEEQQQQRPKMRSVARVPKSMAVAIKAVADAAKDVVKVKPSGNVFDRLGRSTDIPEYNDPIDEDDVKHEEINIPTYRDQNDYSGQYDVGLAYNNEGYNGLERRVKVDASQIGNFTSVVDGSSGNKVQRDQNTPVGVTSFSNKIVNRSSNVNTWKPRVVPEVGDRKAVQDVRVIEVKSNLVTITNGNGAPAVGSQTEVQKTLPSTGVHPTGRPTEDVDSRTIFVSNVHFAATKDSLSRHFNKFGDVLKVVIVTEAATGQPKGSAYVEFMKKEAAENALSLDGTSFLSRILKVVRKSSAQQEPAAATTWPRASRGSSFSASRFGRVSFPRGIPSLYRSRLPMKTGARSLQWKRDAPSESSSPVPSPTTRSLTYVRPEAAAKTNTSSNNA